MSTFNKCLKFGSAISSMHRMLIIIDYKYKKFQPEKDYNNKMSKLIYQRPRKNP